MALTERQQLLDEITARLSGAVQGDFENGVKWLNDSAALEFHQKYKYISEFHKWLFDLYFKELPEDN